MSVKTFEFIFLITLYMVSFSFTEIFLLNFSLSGLLKLVNVGVFNVVSMIYRKWLFGPVLCLGTGFINAMLRYSTLAQLSILLFDRLVYWCLYRL